MSTLRHGIEVAPMNRALWNELGAIPQMEMNWLEAGRGAAAAKG